MQLDSDNAWQWENLFLQWISICLVYKLRDRKQRTFSSHFYVISFITLEFPTLIV